MTQKNVPARDPDKLIFNFSSHFLSDSEKSLLCKGFQHYNKMKLSIKNFFSKCDQIRSFLQIWSHLLKKSLIENFFFCAVSFGKCLDDLSLTNFGNFVYDLGG